jgi:TonB-dependent receptor
MTKRLSYAYALLLCLGILPPAFANAQDASASPEEAVRKSTGIVVGKVVDETTGYGISGVSVSMSGTDVTATTDMNGDYRLAGVPSGFHSLSFYKGGYQFGAAAYLNVLEGDVSRMDYAMRMRDTAASLGEDDIVVMDELVVTAKVLQDNQIGLQAYRSKAISVSDAIGADDFAKQNLGDAAEAMSRVTGASVLDGKYVVVRGLGDRYANTLLNGVALPSADPDKRAVQMDQFPTDLLESIQTAKSFTPDMPGDFAGGSVNVRTKSFPDAWFLSISTSTSWNSNTTGKDILSSPQGVTFLGMDAGNRWAPAIVDGLGTPQTAIAAARSGTNPSLDTANLLSAFSKGFESGMFPKTRTAGPNYGFDIATGDQIPLSADSRIGYTFSVTYDRDNSSFDDGYLAAINPTGGQKALYSPNVSEYDFAENLAGKTFPWGDTNWGYSKSVQSVSWGTFGKLAYQPNSNTEITLDLFHNQYAEDEVRRGVGEEPEDYATMIYENYSMLYTERGMSSAQLHGKHTLSILNDAELDWTAAWNRSTQKQPDFRIVQTLYDLDGGNYSTNTLFPPSRFFRDMDEISKSGSVDLKLPFTLFSGLESNLKVGGTYSRTHRTYFEDQFTMYYGRGGTAISSYDMLVNSYTDNVGILSTSERANGGWDVTFGWSAVETPSYVSNYEGEQEIGAAYAMADLLVAKNWRVVTGLRAEHTGLSVTTFKNDGTVVDEAGIGQTDLLPAASLIYTIRENMNLRLAYGNTLARPTFKELTSSRLYDPFRREYYQGNSDLEMTDIHNFDIRWEWFMEKGQMIALSAFDKEMTNPIEVLYKEDTSGSSTGMSIVSPRNRPDGRVQGLEAEGRYELSNLASWLDDFSVGANGSLISSEVSGGTYNGSVMPDMPLVGQSRYVLNANATYQNFYTGTTVTVLANKVGARLIAVTQLDSVADIYETPPVTLNLVVSQNIWKGLKAKLTVSNILDSAYEATLGKNTDTLVERYKKGRTIGLSLNYTF